MSAPDELVRLRGLVLNLESELAELRPLKADVRELAVRLVLLEKERLELLEALQTHARWLELLRAAGVNHAFVTVALEQAQIAIAKAEAQQ